MRNRNAGKMIAGAVDLDADLWSNNSDDAGKCENVWLKRF